MSTRCAPLSGALPRLRCTQLRELAGPHESATSSEKAAAPMANVTEQRMPSTRPIDRRWDHSRAILIQTTRRPAAGRDFRWNPADGFVFSDTVSRSSYGTSSLVHRDRRMSQLSPNGRECTTPSPARPRLPPKSSTVPDLPNARRYYATRPLPGSRTAQNSPANTPSFADSIALGHEAEQLRQQLASQQAAHEATQEQFRREAMYFKKVIDKLQAMNKSNEDELKERLEKYKDLDAKFKAEQKRIQELHTDIETLREDQRRTVETIERNGRDALLARQREWDQMRAELETPYDDLVLRARRSVEEELQTDLAELDTLQTHVAQRVRDSEEAIQKQERESQEGIEMRERDSQAILDMRQRDFTIALEQIREQRGAWHEKTRLDDIGRRQANDILVAEKSELEAAHHRRTVMRADYDAYRKLWTISEAASEFQFATERLTALLQHRADYWKTLRASYNGALIHSDFPSRYAALNTQIHNFYSSKAGETSSHAREAERWKNLVATLYSDIETLGHRSRLLTRTLRFNPMTNPSDAARITSKMLYIYPMQQWGREMARASDRVSAKLRENQYDTIMEAFRDVGYPVSSLSPTRGLLMDLLVAFDKFNQAKAMTLDPPIEKEAFAASREYMNEYRDAAMRWQNHIFNHPRFQSGYSVSAQEAELRRRVRSDKKELLEEQNALVQIIRRRRYLQAVLGDRVDEEKVEKVIAAEVAEAAQKFRACFTRLFPAKARLSSRKSNAGAEEKITRARGSSRIELASKSSPTASGARRTKGVGTLSGPRSRRLRPVRVIGTSTSRTLSRQSLADSRDQHPVTQQAQLHTFSNETRLNLTPTNSLQQHCPTARNFHVRISKSSASLNSVHCAPAADMNKISNNILVQPDSSFLLNGDFSPSENTAFAPRFAAIDIQDSPLTASTQTENTTFTPRSSAIDSPDSPFTPSTPLSQDETAAVEETTYSLQACSISENVASDPPLRYHISAEERRSAAFSSRSSDAIYWSYKKYRNAEGKTPLVYYCVNIEQAELRVKEFLNEPIVGFDLEWEVYSSPAKHSIKESLSLVQLACDDKIILLHIAMFKGTTANELVPPSLRTILESSEIAKAGVNVRGDASRVRSCLGIEMKGLFELSHLYKIVQYSDTQQQHLINRRPVGLATQVETILLLPLKKDAVRVSQWSKRLEMQQCDYAASDAYAGFQLYHALEAKRKSMHPTPPRPAFHEENKPFVLGDGSRIYPGSIRIRPKPGLRPVAVVPAEADRGEEDGDFFDALENQSGFVDEGSAAGVPLAGIGVAQA